MRVSFYLTLLTTYIVAVVAKRSLTCESLVTCMEGSQLSANFFNVTFNPDDLSVRYAFNFNSEINDYIVADVFVYAYGFRIITETMDLCDSGWTQFCPLFPGQVEVDSIQYIDQDLADRIPGIAYSVPDIDAFVRVIVRGSNGDQVGCIQGFFTNGKTVSQVGIKWATAVIAGLGLLASAITSAFGNSNAASHISANAVSLFLYFQSVVLISMAHVDSVPPIAASWSENLIWSMGLIRVGFMQKIFRWYIQSTGGDPTLYLTSKTINILVQRSFEYTNDLVARGVDYLAKRAAPLVLFGNSNVLIFRGIRRLAYEANIELTSVVVTGFTFFILCAYVLVGFIFVVKYSLELAARVGWIRPTRFTMFRDNWKSILKGSISRYIFIGFTQLVLLSVYEFYIQDSPAVIVLAVLFLLLALTVIGWTAFRVITFGKRSLKEHKNPAALLYGDEKVLDRYGFFYTMFKAQKYWWGIVVIAHAFVKCLFIALGQDSGKTQAMAFWIIDMVYLGVLIHYKPYLNVPTNVISIMIQVVTTVNSFLFTFFSNIYGQDAAVASIMGWVFFILNAAFSLILLIYILLFCTYVIFSKNPDARFRPATDDRASFQRQTNQLDSSKGPAAELIALGLTAKDHDENWQTEIQKRKDSTKSSDNSNTSNDLDEERKVEENEKETFTGMVVRKLTGKSKRKDSSKAKGARSPDLQDKRLLSGASYLDNDRIHDDDDDFSFKNDAFEHTAARDDNGSIGSFGNAFDNRETSTNDFIGSSSEARRSSINLNRVEDDYEQNRI